MPLDSQSLQAHTSSHQPQNLETPENTPPLHENSTHNTTQNALLQENKTQTADTPQAGHSFSKIGAFFIAISIGIFLFTPFAILLTQSSPAGFMLISLSVAYCSYYVLAFIIPALHARFPKKGFCYMPFVVILVFYMLCCFVFFVAMNSVGGGSDGDVYGWAIVFAALPFAFFFIIGNLAYHTQTVLFGFVLLCMCVFVMLGIARVI